MRAAPKVGRGVSKYFWRGIRLQHGEVVSFEAEPAECPRAWVAVGHDSEGRLVSIEVTAFCSEAQVSDIADCLYEHADHHSRFFDHDYDRICRHGGGHNVTCRYQALNLFKSTLRIEMQALLAETDAWPGASEGWPKS